MPSKSTPRVRAVATGQSAPIEPPSALEQSAAHHLNLIRKRELAERLRVNRWTLMRWVRLGRFPAPIRLSDSVIAWRVVDVEAWLRQRERGAE